MKYRLKKASEITLEEWDEWADEMDWCRESQISRQEMLGKVWEGYSKVAHGIDTVSLGEHGAWFPKSWVAEEIPDEPDPWPARVDDGRLYEFWDLPGKPGGPILGYLTAYEKTEPEKYKKNNDSTWKYCAPYHIKQPNNIEEWKKIPKGSPIKVENKLFFYVGTWDEYYIEYASDDPLIIDAPTLSANHKLCRLIAYAEEEQKDEG